MHMFYEWTALSADSGAPPVAAGISQGDTPLAAYAAAAAFLRDERALFASVRECWPLGDMWTGRRNTRGQVAWYPVRARNREDS